MKHSMNHCILSLAVLALSLLSNSVSAQDFTIDTQQSELRILVHRAGLLGGLGHNHVIHTQALQGQVSLNEVDLSQSSLTLSFPVASLIVDDATRRAEEGDDFPGVVPDKDIAGTTKNMFKKVLHAKNFPTISVHSTAISGTLTELSLTLDIDIHGAHKTLVVPVHITQSEHSLHVTGLVKVKQSDLGIKPLKVLFGTIAVQDEIDIKWDILAHD